MDTHDMKPRMIDVELVWVLNTSDGPDYVSGIHKATISWPINNDEIKKLFPPLQ